MIHRSYALTDSSIHPGHKFATLSKQPRMRLDQQSASTKQRCNNNGICGHRRRRYRRVVLRESCLSKGTAAPVCRKCNECNCV